MGWASFICKPDKSPYTPQGFKNATKDPDIIRAWHEKYPDALIGLPCAPNGFFVVDIDRKDGRDGGKSWAELVEIQGGGVGVETGPCQATPSGGWHLFFALPDGIEIPNNSNKLAPGIDLRSSGYVCTGPGYSWLPDHGPDQPLTQPPEWLISEIAKMSNKTPRTTEKKIETSISGDAGAYWVDYFLARAAGRRNEAGFELACQLRDSGLTQNEAANFMMQYANRAPAGDHPYLESEALASLGQAYQAPPREAAHLPGVRVAGSITSENLRSAIRVNGHHPQETSENNQSEDIEGIDIPDLPEAARIDPAISSNVSPWLNTYIAFSRQWSPRAFDGFHEACALWLLSTVAARRVCVDMGKERYTNLYIALTARSSLYAKSSTAEIALQTLRAAGLDWLLSADSATPQKFIADLTLRLVSDYDGLGDDQKVIVRNRLSLAGQRGWYYDEFGQHIAAMMRDGGFMADFRGLLRRMDDTPERYEYGSIGRGSDIIERPYLALLANLTPVDLRPFARRGAGLWGDGFLARFALVTPPDGDRLRDRFPAGKRTIPAELLTPLVAWHKRLGMPAVEIIDVLNEKNEKTGSKRVEITPLAPVSMAIAPEVREAFYTYHDGLLDLLAESENHDLDGNYARLAEKALRVASLLASLDNQSEVTLPYWAKGQAVAENWRAGLHYLYAQINEPPASKTEENEEKLLQVITRHGASTPAQAARFVRGLSSGEAAILLDGLVNAGLLQSEKTQRGTKRYGLSQEP